MGNLLCPVTTSPQYDVNQILAQKEGIEQNGFSENDAQWIKFLLSFLIVPCWYLLSAGFALLQSRSEWLGDTRQECL